MWIEPQSGRERFLCLSCSAGKYQDTCLAQLCIRIVRIEADRDICLFLGKPPLTLVIQCPCQHSVPHSIVGVEFDCGLRFGFCQFYTLRKGQSHSESTFRNIEQRQ